MTGSDGLCATLPLKVRTPANTENHETTECSSRPLPDRSHDSLSYPRSRGAIITLHHIGWGDSGAWDKVYAYFDRAWGNVLGNLKQRFAAGPMDWTEGLTQLKKMNEAAPAKN